MSEPREKRTHRPKIPEGKVIIGKHIPTHWGKSEIVAWDVHEEPGGVVERYKTRKEACIMFPYLKKHRTYQAPAKICPRLKFEKALMNPYVVDWKNCFVPTEEDMKPPKKMMWAVKGWSQEKGRWITCGHLQSQEIAQSKLRKQANKAPNIISNSDKLNLDKPEPPNRTYWFIFELEKWEE